MKGVILDSQTLKPSELDFSDLEKLLPEWTFYEQSGPDDVKNRLRGVTVAITNKVVIDADTLAASPDLKLICISATGTNNVDLEAARRQGVVVCNVSGYATATVAQHTLALMLGLATAWHRYDADARAGRWSESDMFCRMDYPVVELAGKTLGLIGHGDLGRRVAAPRGGQQRPGAAGHPARRSRCDQPALPAHRRHREDGQPGFPGRHETRRLSDQHRARRPGG